MTYSITSEETRRSVFYARGYGAKGDGVADDTAALQEALDAVAAAHGVLIIAAGTYKITGAISLVQKSNFGVRGPTKQGGTYSTVVKWSGAQGGTMLLLDGVRDSEWTNIGFDGNTAGVEPAVIVEIDKISAGSTISRKNSFKGCMFRGGSTATVRIAQTSTTNNEAHVFEDCENYAIVVKTGIGYQVKNINAKNIQVVRGLISGKDIAVSANSGSIGIHSTEIGGSNVWLRVGGGVAIAGGEPIVIENCDGDSSTTFLVMDATQTNPVFAMGNRFIQNVDGDLFTFLGGNGPLILMGNEFAAGGYRAGATVAMGVNNGPRMIALGNVFPNVNLLPFPDPTTGRFAGLYSFGNMGYTAPATLTYMDDVISPHSVTALRMNGNTGFLGSAQDLTVASAPLSPSSGVVLVTPGGDYTLTAEPTIGAGKFAGQEVRLLNVGTHSFTLQDRGTLAGSTLALVAATVTVPVRASIVLTWSATLGLWIQTGPLVAPL